VSDGFGHHLRDALVSAYRSRWSPGDPASRLAVTQCCFDAAVTLILGDADASFVVRIEEPFVVSIGDGRECVVDPARDRRRPSRCWR
jgi:hypothetical protein